MNSKYKILKYSANKFENVEDLISIEEPLEISLRFKEQDKWISQNLSITMRTPGNDEDLVRGFLFNEQIFKVLKILILLKVMEIKLVNTIFKIRF